jgi:hypothetical protein
MVARWMLALLVLLPACRSKESPPSSSSPDPGSAKLDDPRVHTFSPPDIALPAQRSFKLLSAGEAPHAILRYALASRETTFGVTTQLASRRLAGATWSERVAIPAITTSLVISAATPDRIVGRAVAAVVTGGASPETDQYVAGWSSITGRRIAIALDARGQLGPISFPDDPKGTTPTDDLAQRLLGTLVPVPEEPVGIGASWRVVTILRQRPAIVKQTATYKLVKRTGSTWTIDVDIMRLGEAQTLVDPAVPADTAIELINLVRKLHGTIEIDPTSPFGAGELAVESTMHLRIQAKARGATEEILEDTGTIRLTVH